MPNPSHEDLLLCFLLGFIVSALTFRSMNHSELSICMLYEVGVQLHSFACRYSIAPAPSVEKTILSPLNGLVGNQLTINIKVYFWTLSSMSYIQPYLCQFQTILIIGALW